MCSVFGFFGKYDESHLTAASDLMHRRGPDSSKSIVYNLDEVRLGLAHRRLAIIDLSPAGSQPMKSSCGRYSIVFNGEIYNVAALKKHIGSVVLRGHSDTEVWLECMSQIGIQDTLAKTEGMFAAAIFDHHLKELFLIRDRLGEKPLYYNFDHKKGIIFGSELKSIKFFNKSLSLSREAVVDYLKFGCITKNLSIYENVYKLLPGHILKVKYDQVFVNELIRYWEFPDYMLTNNSMSLSFAEAVEAIEERMVKILEQQIVSDVPAGAFLSGGIDSALVSALITKKLRKPLNTFTIGLIDSKLSEASTAKTTSQLLQTNHTEFLISAKDALDFIPHLADIYDEPFSDSSQLPTLLLSRLARKKVTVALSGDGGDEVFYGYNRYLFISQFSSLIGDSVKNRFLATGVKKFESLLGFVGDQFLSHKAVDLKGKVHKIYSALSSKDIGDYYNKLISKWKLADIAKTEISYHLSHLNKLDAEWYLPDDILVKVDRASMWNSLETRAPYLDNKLIELASQFPLDFHIRNGQGKLILREILKKYLPEDHFSKPKSGFGIPLREWLKEDLKEWSLDLLNFEKLWELDLIDKDKVMKVWDLHQRGVAHREQELWAIILLQQWLQKWT